jgi:hypothetical protein
MDNTQKDPEDWVTGDERMTGAQASYLQTLCQEAGEEFDETLTKADASKRIDELQSRTGRGVPADEQTAVQDGGGAEVASEGRS